MWEWGDDTAASRTTAASLGTRACGMAKCSLLRACNMIMMYTPRIHRLCAGCREEDG